jgi:Ca-activated chloride channel family protein
MDMLNRLPLLKSAFKLLIDNLRDLDTVSIVIYGSSAGVWLGPTSGADKATIRKSIEDLTPGGATSGESGIRTAYRLAKSQFIRSGNNRVVLATDGDFNVGQQTEDELDLLVTQHQKLGIYLTCLGVGMGNYKDSKLEILAKKGNGNFSYLDNETEAQKVLVKEMTQTLYSVADDAYLNINFNPSKVKEYRLLGYDNKGKAMADSLSVVEGGELGSGHSQMAIFQIKPQMDSSSNLNPSTSLAKIWVDYKNPGDSLVRKKEYEANPTFKSWTLLESNYKLAISLGVFTSLLKDSPYMKKMDWNIMQKMASQSIDTNDPVQVEFLNVLAKAKKIYSKMSRKSKTKLD